MSTKQLYGLTIPAGDGLVEDAIEAALEFWFTDEDGSRDAICSQIDAIEVAAELDVPHEIRDRTLVIWSDIGGFMSFHIGPQFSGDEKVREGPSLEPADGKQATDVAVFLILWDLAVKGGARPFHTPLVIDER